MNHSGRKVLTLVHGGTKMCRQNTVKVKSYYGGTRSASVMPHLSESEPNEDDQGTSTVSSTTDTCSRNINNKHKPVNAESAPVTTNRARMREENRGPIRTLLSELETARTSSPYPRNHVEMMECSNSARHLARYASGKRTQGSSSSGSVKAISSSSSDGTFPLNGNLFGDKKKRKRKQHQQHNQANKSHETRTGAGEAVGQRVKGLLDVDKIDLSKLNGPSAYSLSNGKGQPTPQAKRQNVECDYNAEQLNALDTALKERLAMRLDRQSDNEPLSARYPLAYGSTGVLNTRSAANAPKPYSAMTSPTNSMISIHFRVLGEQFKSIKFADGPVDANRFDRRHGFCGYQIQQQYNSEHLPKQVPCMRFKNILHKNHRQRHLNVNLSQSLDCSSMSLPESTRPLVDYEQPVSPSLGPSYGEQQLQQPATKKTKTLKQHHKQQQKQRQQQQEQLKVDAHLHTDNVATTSEPNANQNIPKISAKKIKTNTQAKTKVKTKPKSSNEIIKQVVKPATPATATTTTATTALATIAKPEPPFKPQNTPSQDASTSNNTDCRSSHATQMQMSNPKRTPVPKMPQMVDHKMQPVHRPLLNSPHETSVVTASTPQESGRSIKDNQQIMQTELMHMDTQEANKLLQHPIQPATATGVKAQLKVPPSSSTQTASTTTTRSGFAASPATSSVSCGCHYQTNQNQERQSPADATQKQKRQPAPVPCQAYTNHKLTLNSEVEKVVELKKRQQREFDELKKRQERELDELWHKQRQERPGH